MTTDFGTKVDLLASFFTYYVDEANVDEALASSEFWQVYESIVVMCLYKSVGYVEILNKGLVDDAFDSFLDYLGLDKYGDYSDIHELMELANA
jgi:hypothetical protein